MNQETFIEPVKEVQTKKSKFKDKLFKKALPAMAGAVGFSSAFMQTAMAADENSPLTAITNLQTIFFGVIAGIGLLVLGKSIADFASAYQAQDSSGMHSAAKGIAAGAMMASVGAIVTFIFV